MLSRGWRLAYNGIVTKPPPRGRATVERVRDGRVLRRTTIYFTPATFRRLRFYCVDVDREISDVVEEAVKEWLERVDGG